MKAVTVDYPMEWQNANIYTLADLHIGDPLADKGEIDRRIQQIVDDPHGLCVLNGDLLNTALRNSVSDVYGETMSPMDAIVYLVDLLKPVQDKIIGATTGNHENRVYKSDGIDMMRLVAREMGFEERYAPEGIVIFLRFGKGRFHGVGRERSKRCYSFYVSHGSGGGKKEGAKAIRLAEMSMIADVDCYIIGHTHLPMTFKEAYYRVDKQNQSVTKVEKTFVNTAATLDYGGYGQSGLFKPNSVANPVIHLDGARQRITVTL